MSKAKDSTEEEKKIQRSDYFKVAIGIIEVEKDFNVREDLTGIDELARSIATIGQETPLEGFRVRGKEKFVLSRGHRRLAAIKLANEKYIGKPGFLKEKITHAILMTGSSDTKQRILGMLLDGDATQNLTNEEMVKGIARLLDLGVAKKEIITSLAIGESQAQKYNLVKAAEAPKAVLKMIEQGQLSVAKVNEIQRATKDESEQVKLAEKASQEGRKQRGEKKENSVILLLEEALSLSDLASPKAATLQAIVRKLKSKASAEDIAKLLK